MSKKIFGKWDALNHRTYFQGNGQPPHLPSEKSAATTPTVRKFGYRQGNRQPPHLLSEKPTSTAHIPTIRGTGYHRTYTYRQWNRPSSHLHLPSVEPTIVAPTQTVSGDDYHCTYRRGNRRSYRQGNRRTCRQGNRRTCRQGNRQSPYLTLRKPAITVPNGRLHI